MTLTEIAQFAGSKVGKTDSDTLDFLQKSASLNYRRVWNFAYKHEAALTAATASHLSPANVRTEAKVLRREMHLVLKQVSYDYERMQYNTVVSGCMKLLNALEGFKAEGQAAAVRDGFSVLLRVLYPATPHIAHQLWQDLGFAAEHGDLLDAPWPQCWAVWGCWPQHAAAATVATRPTARRRSRPPLPPR